MDKALIIGGGFAGCAAAHQLTLMGRWEVTLVESSPFLGGGVRTQWYGGHPYTFGPRHFLTQNDRVYFYLNRLLPLRLCSEHEFITYVERDRAFYNFPIHLDDVRRMPDKRQIDRELQELSGAKCARTLEEYWLASVGRTLYGKFIEKYSEKMWRVEDNNRIDTFNWSPKGVALKQGPRAAWDVAISAYPYAPDGYNSYFDIATARTNVLLNTRIDQFDIPKKLVTILGERIKFHLIINTISPDALFDYCYGELAYVGREFYKIILPIEHAFPKNVYFVYYANEEPFTRLVEYKKFTRHQAPTTLVGMEIPCARGRHYPVPFKSELTKAAKYHAEMPTGVFSMGRHGSYRYAVGMDGCIEQAFELTTIVKQGGADSPVPVSRFREP